MDEGCDTAGRGEARDDGRASCSSVASAEGVLAFPATAFHRDGALDAGCFAAHIADLAGTGPTAIVPAGGAGELFSLSLDEHERLVGIAVAAARRHSGDRRRRARASPIATRDGAGRRARRAPPAILLFPPYLIAAGAGRARRLCRGGLPVGRRSRVIVYSRNNGVLAPDTALRLADACPNLIALKDGTGDFEALVSLEAARRRPAGADQRRADRRDHRAAMLRARHAAATPRRSSPSCRRWRSAISGRVRDGDRATVDRLLAEFYVPLTAIRNRRRGYAVAIVKAGLRRRRPAGRAGAAAARRPQRGRGRSELAALIARAGELVDERRPATPVRRRRRRGERDADRALGHRARRSRSGCGRCSTPTDEFVDVPEAPAAPVDGRRADRLALRGEGRGARRASACCRRRAPAPTRSTSHAVAAAGVGLQRLRARGADRRICLRRHARPRRRLSAR